MTAFFVELRLSFVPAYVVLLGHKNPGNGK